MRIDYSTLEDEVFHLLGDSSIMVLATCKANRVTARSMSCLIYNKKIYFQTNEDFVKYDQIIFNPNIALCVNNLQMEGIAHIKKHPKEEPEFSERFLKYFKASYGTYSQMSKEVVVEVEPTFITLWKYENGQPLRDFLNLSKKEAYRELYDTTI